MRGPQNFDECVAAGGYVHRVMTGYDECRLTLRNSAYSSFAACIELGGQHGYMNERTPDAYETCALVYAEYGPLCLSGKCP